MNNPFDYIPDTQCDAAFRALCARLDGMRASDDDADVNFCRELDEGKMLGVLIAEDAAGERHTLFAFSGQLGAEGFYHEGFAGPVFDYLRPEGYFKRKEADISRQTSEIAEFETKTLARVRRDFVQAQDRLGAEVAAFRESCLRSKAERDARRASGCADEAEIQAMTRRSQHEKAELHRMKKRAAAELQPYRDALDRALCRLSDMKERRRADSEALQAWLFSNFTVLNARGESRSLSEIFAATSFVVPPSGAGECCAPKLLQAAYLEGLTPVAMAEYWYGKPKSGEVRIHGRHYPACRGKCLPILRWMLQGLDVHPPLDCEREAKEPLTPEIIFENEWFCVIEKPSGMLSVPGKGSAVSAERWLQEIYGPDRDVRMAHRLDRDTSGLLVAAFGPIALKTLQSLFGRRSVHKTYVALLEGDYRARGIPEAGRIELPLSPDVLDRPRQRVDKTDGKEAATDYEFVGVESGRSRVTLHPLTGRTHQLRVHAASQAGLGMPIAGDPLYGLTPGDCRLMLHAARLEFTFPIDGVHYAFDSPVPF
ncbi:MAG: RluA family pseudouridine synthase [Muribaculaceae bacterium]|nr:RluA family pseudouridine synthase [Muribaculaceae bacterium]